MLRRLHPAAGCATMAAIMDDTSRWQLRTENDCLFVDDTERGMVILQHNFRPGVGSYIHPLRLDGVCLTEDSPWHHPHQHGIQTRFVGINGSDFWHYPGQRPGQTLGRIDPAAPQVTADAPPRWTIESLWRRADGSQVIAERQEWALSAAGGLLLLDLDWTLRAIPAVTFAPYPYGGLYVRMPFRSHLGAAVVTSAGLRDDAAEQQPATWVDVEMPLEHGASRKGAAPVSAGLAVCDHPANHGHPACWRVDGQRGINPAPTIAGAIELQAGTALQLRYRLIAHRGPLAAARIEELWAAHAAT